MEQKSQKDEVIISQGDGAYRSYPIYKNNPSISDGVPIKMKKKEQYSFDNADMVIPDTGEIIARGAFGFIEHREVDTEEFVKIYLAGIRQYGQLTKAGAKMFEYVYQEMSGHKGKDKDTIMISLRLAKEWYPRLTKPTYHRGLAELLDRNFIFRSYASTDMYFVNVRYMFNGDRIALAKVYYRKETPEPFELPSNQ
jgi:hypothetical protein